MEKAAKTNKFVSILSLPKQEVNLKPKTLCNAAGWGVTDPGSNRLSDFLREVNLTIVDNKSCNKAYSKKEKVTITSSMICAGPLTNRKEDTCNVRIPNLFFSDNTFTIKVFSQFYLDIK